MRVRFSLRECLKNRIWLVRIAGLTFLLGFSSILVLAQKRAPIRRKTSKPPAIVKNSEPPLVPQYQASSGNSPNRVILPWSSVANAKGAPLVKMSVRYVYDDYWWQIARLNEVSITFGMNPNKRVCADSCHFVMNVDGQAVEVSGDGSASSLADGSISETVSVWMRPEAFKKIVEAKKISVQVSNVSFGLTEQQMEGLRQMLPFLRIRKLP